ncbi:hypothetical protein ACSZN6_17405, partial [Aeromonas hydrophila]
GGDVALGFTFDADITWSWHGYAPDWLNGNDTRPNQLAATMPLFFIFIFQRLKQHKSSPAGYMAQKVATSRLLHH